MQLHHLDQAKRTADLELIGATIRLRKPPHTSARILYPVYLIEPQQWGIAYQMANEEIIRVATTKALLVHRQSKFEIVQDPDNPIATLVKSGSKKELRSWTQPPTESASPAHATE